MKAETKLEDSVPGYNQWGNSIQVGIDKNDKKDKESGVQKTFRNFSVHGNKIVPNFEGSNTIERLSPGSYTLHYDQQRGVFWFEPLTLVSDGILDLPSPEYTKVVQKMALFMKPETRAKFERMNYIYKRSALLHGVPGTGKTVIVNRVARDIVSLGGICLWATQPALLKLAYEILDDIQPNVLTGVIFEEFDEMARRHESELLTLLDGQVQKHNVIYLATTNYLNKVPKRLYRPGRFATVLEVKFPIPEARRLYLASKLGADFPDLEARVQATEGLSIDELKEVVQAVDILEEPLAEVLERLKATREFSVPERDEDSDYDDGDDFEGN